MEWQGQEGGWVYCTVRRRLRALLAAEGATRIEVIAIESRVDDDDVVDEEDEEEEDQEEGSPEMAQCGEGEREWDLQVLIYPHPPRSSGRM